MSAVSSRREFILTTLGAITFSSLAFAQEKLLGSDVTKILCVGDAGTSDSAQRHVANSMLQFQKSNSVDFALLLGDNFYDYGVSSVDDPQFQSAFEVPYGPLGIPFYITLGNHDYGLGSRRGNVQAQIDYTARSKLWNLPSRYYKLQKPNVDIFVLDTVTLYNDPTQLTWFKQEFLKSQSRFKLVVGHYPIYSNGDNGDTSFLIKDILPILETSKENTLYLCGHDHDLEYLISPKGVHLAVCGGGSYHRSLSGDGLAVFQRATTGFAFLEISSTEFKLTFLDGNGVPVFQKNVGT